LVFIHWSNGWSLFAINVPNCDDRPDEKFPKKEGLFFTDKFRRADFFDRRRTVFDTSSIHCWGGNKRRMAGVQKENDVLAMKTPLGRGAEEAGA
jgi:hypothetical protein